MDALKTQDYFGCAYIKQIRRYNEYFSIENMISKIL